LRGYDVVSAHEVQTHSLSDLQQLEFSITQGRAIFTFKVGDFNRLHKEYLKSGKAHFVILLSKQTPIGETIKHLVTFLFNHSLDKTRNNILWI